MAADTTHPGLSQNAAVIVTATPPVVDTSSKETTLPTVNTASNGSSVYNDMVAAQQSTSSAVLTLKQAVYKQPHKRPPINAAQLRGMFTFDDKRAEETEGVEIVLDASRNVPVQSNSRDYASIRPAINFEARSTGDWQRVIDAHARHDSSGHAIDDGGKRIDITHINAEFGQRLAQICDTLDAQGYAGRYEIISGVRSKEEQQALYAAYKKAGSNHPVALPGSSLHELGCAVDIKSIGGNSAAFFDAYHVAALQAGCALVANDKEHVQLPRGEVHNFIMQQGPHFQNVPYEMPRHQPALHTI